MRDKTSLQITGKRLALPVCIPSKGAPAPRCRCQCRCRCCRRRTLRGSRAWGCHGTPLPLTSPVADPALRGWPGAGSGPGGTMQWVSSRQHPQPERGGTWVPGVGLLLHYPPTRLRSLRSVPAPQGSRNSSTEVPPSHQDKAEVSSGSSHPGTCPHTRPVPGLGSTHPGPSWGLRTAAKPLRWHLAAG